MRNVSNKDADDSAQLLDTTTSTTTVWENWTRIRKMWLSPEYAWTAADLLKVEERIRISSRKRSRKSFEESWELFERMCQEIQRRPAILEEDPKLRYWCTGYAPRMTLLLNVMLDSWRIASRLEPDKIISPSELIHLLERTGIPLNARTYTILMSTSIHVDDGDEAPQFCEDVVNHMLDTSIQVDTPALTAPFQAWAKSTRRDAVERAQNFWKRLCELDDNGFLQFQPSIVTYNTYFEILAKAKSKSAMEEADRIFQTLSLTSQDERPDSDTYRILITGHADLFDPNHAVTAIGLLQEMTERSLVDSGDRSIDHRLFTMMIARLTYDLREYTLAEKVYECLLLSIRDTDVIPDPNVFRAMITVYSNTGRYSKAETLLYSLEHQAVSQNDRSFLPTLDHYRDILNAILEDGDNDSLDRAEEFLSAVIHRTMFDEMHVELSPMIFNDMLLAWSRSNRKDKAERAESFLATMIESTNTFNAKSFQFAILAWVSSNDPDAGDRAEDILCSLDRRHRMGLCEFKPNIYHYAGVIAAHGRSGRFDSRTSVRELYDHALRLSCNDTVDSKASGSLMKASFWAFVELEEYREAERVLLDAMSQVRGDDKPELLEKILEGKASLHRKTANDERARSLLSKLEELGRTITEKSKL